MRLEFNGKSLDYNLDGSLKGTKEELIAQGFEEFTKEEGK